MSQQEGERLLSPDGQWWWDGEQWQPVQQGPPPPPSASTMAKSLEQGQATAPAFELEGVNGPLEVWPTMVVIRRKGDLAKLPQGSFAGKRACATATSARSESGWPGALTPSSLSAETMSWCNGSKPP